MNDKNATDRPFVVSTWYSAGADDYRNLYHRNIAVYEDGTLILYTNGKDDLKLGSDVPVFKKQLDKTQVNRVKKILQEQRFWSLPEDISTPSEDGGFNFIAVNVNNKLKKVGGLNPDHAGFTEIHDEIFGLVAGEDFKKWTGEVEEYIWEWNSLRINGKTDYHLEEPFLIFSMEHIWNESSRNVYQHKIAIDIDGHLTLYAEEGANVEIGEDAPVLEMDITDETLNKLKALIQTHFWKLNAFIRNIDGGDHRESITVQLMDEFKTVEGNDPDHYRFTTIRDEIIRLIDAEDYEVWLEEIEEHISELNPESSTNEET